MVILPHLVVAGEPLLPRVGLAAADHFAPVDGVLGVHLGVALEVFLAREGLVALRAVVDPLHLLTPAVPLHVIVCIRLVQQQFIPHAKTLSVFALVSVADPVRCLFDPWFRIRDGKKSGSGIKISYYIYESLIALLSTK
jgi:hypothetical protein